MQPEKKLSEASRPEKVRDRVLLFSGFNQRAVVSFIRTLESVRIPYSIIAKSAGDTIFKTEYGRRVEAVRTVTALDHDDLFRCLGDIRRQHPAGRLLIIPSAEALNRFLLDHPFELKALQCTVPLPGAELYRKLSDKYSFGKLCSDNGIAVPEELSGGSGLAMPYVAKPRRYVLSDGSIQAPVIVSDETGSDRFFESHRADDFYFQQYIGGKSYYLLYYFYQDGSAERWSQQNLVQQHGGRSMIAAVGASLHREPVADQFERMLSAACYRGLIMIEVKEQGGKYYMIEANPRLWGPSQLFVDSGINFFESLLADYGLLASRPVHNAVEGKRYFWFGGLLETLREGHLPDYHQYAAEQLQADLPAWMAADIYCRPDTNNLFCHECSGD